MKCYISNLEVKHRYSKFIYESFVQLIVKVARYRTLKILIIHFLVVLVWYLPCVQLDDHELYSYVTTLDLVVTNQILGTQEKKKGVAPVCCVPHLIRFKTSIQCHPVKTTVRQRLDHYFLNSTYS